jgi:hypothetical protein
VRSRPPTKAFPSLSADGNTAIVGGYNDDGGIGVAWVYTRSGTVWTQQGSKLAGTGAVGQASQGVSISLSSDGNTAIVGGVGDNGNIGAAWVYTRSNGVWTSRAISWLLPTRLDKPPKAYPSRCPATATPPSWAEFPASRLTPIISTATEGRVPAGFIA